jgi:hypothetical protein
MTLSANNFTFSLTPGAYICENIVETIAKIHSFGNSALPIALFTGHNIVGVLRATSLAVWAGNLFLNQHWEFLAKIKIF